jgi:hypothetical protein
VNPDRQVTRVLLAGDWHGNRDWAAACFEIAAGQGCPVILQLGDFGLWPGREDEWLDHLQARAEATGVGLAWIDGNHENHDALDRWRAGAGGRGGDGLVPMRPDVRWAPRGARWEWGTVRFGALGGAVSIDRFLRRPGVNWWPQEATAEADADRLGDGPLDVLVTHAAPGAVTFPSLGPPRPLRLPASILDDCREVRRVLDVAVARTDPRLVVFGHHHIRVRTAVPGRRFEGLAHDKAGSPDAWAVLHLDGELTVDP